MKAAYLCDVVGDGRSPETAFRPALADIVPGVAWSAAAGGTVALGKMLVIAELTEAEQALVAGDPRVYLVRPEVFADAMRQLRPPTAP